jgi:hypothetical protein
VPVSYYAGFEARAEVDPSVDGAKPPRRPHDVGGDSLPFDQLADRRFEILAYRLKSSDPTYATRTVTLMQGTGERGRDVVVYSTTGALEEILQCKLFRDRITLPDVRAELVKLALHHYLEPTILAEGRVIYELWCPPGLTEPAAELFDRWPTGWEEESVAPAVVEAKKKYRAFEGIDWATARESVLNKFTTLVRPRKITGIDITAQVRSNIPVYEAFFEGNVVMKRDDVAAVVKEYLAAGNLRQISADDTRHLLDRIDKIPSAKRLYLGHGYLMGLKPELFGFMSSEERTKIGVAILSGVTDAVSVVIAAGQRVCRKLLEQIKRVAKFDHISFLYVVHQGAVPAPDGKASGS